ncbi:similar to Saccharomyces cerevisiae YGL105W ARC1 Protein that binds tRNA and methionyl- and glutamyl-tRNA synthetases (Mes1p and Gus1p) [Maudiozyma barnettii]|uniref:Similar to Saccharomyces cerevisiae YGL105W ARC1 Protein that binds tRNA and methionyl- and glutamyl-tRNA synthetases (Mes1p and Gus1p) n=1 Tax=Maudiozyma barnettii TaxID=61262 RepID=A0A8H2ZM31_9SACH|nr:Arc1p [Kazachstania barnettii]CAB4256687.1 similar to Saccharomyces cerevisiae YGL105W ARC1 Protein that binds tRNA and methionyl- and glutamyl-tRNA synthetases (Mes1p and Gus1p) [Kazachstania barnettii]CAD1785343.1 similar to Saccharomyces cerevisiae YGL105W ARC1 Protein that binds tRNA and methionyl- and glutamyl-tRNA synthetases (Mes1p and Gus1p) [Kazachstania barnettii]
MSDLITKFKTLSISSPALSREQNAFNTQWQSVLKSGQVEQQLDQMNLFLRDNTFLVSTLQPTETDVEVFEAVLPLSKQLVSSTKDVKDVYAKYRHVFRWVDYLQNLLAVPSGDQLTLNHDLELPREIIEKKKKSDGKAADAKADAGVKDAKKADKKATDGEQKQRGKPDEETLKKLREEAKAKKAAKKAAKAQEEAAKGKDGAAAAGAAGELPAPSVVDFRVGFIQEAVKHPNADSLYVSTIDVGDEEGPRTVCSGLVKHFPLEAMQQRYVVVVCNLKPVNMRSIKSTAMVLCGSDEEHVEFVEPPAGSVAGDKVFFEGFGAEEPLKQLNPKKKIWEALQPHFSTNGALEVVFKKEDGSALKLTNAKGESFKVASIQNANVR